MRILRHPSGIEQRLAVADLANGGVDTFESLLRGERADVVYSDPPWSPGNEKWWRRHGGHEPPRDYGELLRGWCACVVAADPIHVFVEQSVIVEHRQLLLDAIRQHDGWRWPLQKTWTVCYGSPLRPNVLLHFGPEPCSTDPSGMHGNSMTRRALGGVPINGPIADPCTGLGMTSRMAHEYDVDFVGTELTPARLDRAVAWLRNRGYAEA